MMEDPRRAHKETGGYKWIALAMVMIGTFMAILDNSIVNVALPHMMAAFNTDLEKIRWVATAYMIAYGVVVLTSNTMGDRFGHERLYLAALGLFTIGSFMCGQAWDVNSMIAFRAFQAIGGGLMLPTGMTIITRAFKPQERGTAFGMFGMVTLLAPVLGPTLGGYLVDSVGWPYIFLINIPVGIAGVLFGISSFRFTLPGVSRPFDWPGFFGLGTGFTALLLALSQGDRWGWSSGNTVTCFSLAALGFYIFVMADLYSSNPIIDLSLFANLPFALISAISLLRAVTLFGRTLFLSLFMQTVMGYSALSAGVYLIPGAITAGLFTPLFGRLADRVGAKPLIIPGFIILTWSFWLYHDLSPDSPYSAIFWPLLLFGIGMSAVTSPMMSSAMNVVLPRQIGMVSILQTVFMQIGGAYGINCLEVIINSRTTFHLQNIMEAFTSSIGNLSGRWVVGPMGALNPHSPQALRSLGIALYGQKMATAWAYDDAFIIISALSLLTLFLACFFHEPRKSPPVHHEEEIDEVG